MCFIMVLMRGTIVFSELQISQISGGVVGTLVVIGAIVIVFIIVKHCRQRTVVNADFL